MEESEESFDLELDCRGLYCPLPLVKARAAMDTLEPGGILFLVATDSGSLADMAAYCRVTGNELVSSRETEGEYRFLIRKSEG